MPCLTIAMWCSPVAQLVERVAVNHHVAGSSPARGANSPQMREGLGRKSFTALISDASDAFPPTSGQHHHPYDGYNPPPRDAAECENVPL